MNPPAPLLVSGRRHLHSFARLGREEPAVASAAAARWLISKQLSIWPKSRKLMTPMRAIRLHGGHVIARCDFSGRALGAPLRIPVICIRHFEKSGYFVPSSLILRELTTDIVDLSCTIVRWALPPPADAARGGKVLDLIFPKLPPLIGRCNVACNRSTK